MKQGSNQRGGLELLLPKVIHEKIYTLSVKKTRIEPFFTCGTHE